MTSALRSSSYAHGDFRSAPPSCWAALHAQIAPAVVTMPQLGILSDDASEDFSNSCEFGSYGTAASTSLVIALDRKGCRNLGVDLVSATGGAQWIIESFDGSLVTSRLEDSFDIDIEEEEVNEQVGTGDQLTQDKGRAHLLEALDRYKNPRRVLKLNLLRREAQELRSLERLELRLSVTEAPSSPSGSSSSSRADFKATTYVGEGILPGQDTLAWSLSPTGLAPPIWSPQGSPDFSLINAAVADAPLTLSETYAEAVPQDSYSDQCERDVTGNVCQGLRLPLAKAESQSLPHKCNILSETGVPRKRVHHGLRFVKARAKRMAWRTRSGAQAPATRRGAAGGQFTRAQVSRKVSKNASAVIFAGVAYVKDQAESGLSAVPSQVSGKAQKGLGYVKEQAMTASAMISAQMSETARKSLKFAKNLATSGGA